MDFFKNNNFSSNTDLTLESIKQEEEKFSLFIRTKEQKLIACGIYDPKIDDSEYKFSSSLYYDEVFFMEELRKNEGFIFLIADNHFYSSPVNQFIWSSKKKKKWSDFQSEIEEVFSTQKRNAEQKQDYVEWNTRKLLEDDPLLNHLHKTIESLGRLLATTEKDGWNFLEIQKEEVESDLKTLNAWKLSPLDGHRTAIFKNICKKYDYNWIE